MYIHILFFLYIAEPDTTLNVTIISNPPIYSTICINETVVLTCQVFNANQPTYIWSSDNFHNTNLDESIQVVAANDPKQYYCTVYDVATKRNGKANITIFGSGMFS